MAKSHPRKKPAANQTEATEQRVRPQVESKHNADGLAPDNSAAALPRSAGPARTKSNRDRWLFRLVVSRTFWLAFGAVGVVLLGKASILEWLLWIEKPALEKQSAYVTALVTTRAGVSASFESELGSAEKRGDSEKVASLRTQLESYEAAWRDVLQEVARLQVELDSARSPESKREVETRILESIPRSIGSSGAIVFIPGTDPLDLEDGANDIRASLRRTQDAEVVTLAYDDVLLQGERAWSAATDRVAFAASRGEMPTDLREWLSAVVDDGEFFSGGMARVVMYRYFRAERDAVRARVAKALMSFLSGKGATEAKGITIVGHELGTAIAHDVLHLIATTAVGGQRVILDPRTFKFDAVVMLTNMSRLLQNDIPAYNSMVRPGDPGDAGSICMRYVSINDESDPLGQLRRFSPVWNDLRYSELTVHGDPTLHADKLKSYLASPAVYCTVSNLLTHGRAYTAHERIELLDAFARSAERHEEPIGKRLIANANPEAATVDCLRIIFGYLKATRRNH